MTSRSLPSTRPYSRCSRLMFRLGPLVVFALFMVLAFPVLGRADSLKITFNETTPASVSNIATAMITLGAPDTGQCASCFFISNVDFTSGLTFSGMPSTSLFFDMATGDLGGSDSFTFTGHHGGTHDATFTFTDGTPDWKFSDDNITSGVTQTASGTYTVASAATATPEPGSLLLLGAGLLGFAPFLRRRFRVRSGS